MAGVLDRIENGFDATKAITFSQRYWHWSIYISIAYVLSIFAIQKWMKNRRRYDLRRPLFLWSLILSLFSMYGFYAAGTTQLRYLINDGWERSVCDSIINYKRGGLWVFLFCFSKGPELVDTYFIVLRKQKLIFLHWYHHVTVFIYCWYHWSYPVNPDQWFATVNYFVHAIMYLYYAVRATGRYRPPVWINISITLIQLLQMVFGSYVNIYIFTRMTADSLWYCDGIVERQHSNIYWAFAMYASYFTLFAHFFYKTYVHKKGRKVVGKDKESTANGSLQVDVHKNGVEVLREKEKSIGKGYVKVRNT